MVAVLWIARTGCSCSDLPPEFGRWNSVSVRFAHWSKTGVWHRLSLSEILCVRHNMSARRSMYAKQDEQEEPGSGAAQPSQRTH
ncbi:transposase [Methylococcus capsulatus]|uniref:transposase n=1 Tax=Methylococcus capsulatus TaxID=414 RepID=UPI003CE4664F